MKKFSWILALLAAFAMVFVGCGGGDDTPPPPPAEGDLEITDAAEIGKLLNAMNYYGSIEGSSVKVEGNKAIFDIASGQSTDNNGFKFTFPAEAVGYLSLEVTFKLVSVTTLTGDGTAKIGFKSATADLTPYDDYELVFGGADAVGTELTQKFKLSGPNVLPGGVFRFNHNKYGPSPDPDKVKGSEPPVAYTLEITKVVFKGGEITKVDLAASDFNVSGKDQEVDKVVAVTVTAKDGVEAGTITVNYEGTGETTYAKSATVPQAVGTYKILVSATGSDAYNPATDLDVGTLTVSPPYAGGATEIDVPNWANAGNETTQCGWEFSDDGLDFALLADAKCLVIKAVDAGTNADGFGGMSVIIQPGLSGWNETKLNGDWANKPADVTDATDSTVYIVIPLSGLAKFDDLIEAGKGRLVVAYYNADVSQFTGYLLSGIPEAPEGATVMDVGFITADASIIE